MAVEPESSGLAGIITIEWPSTRRFGDIVSFATLTVRDAYTGEVLVGLTDLHIRANGSQVTAEITEVVGESGNPIRYYNQHEKAASSPDGERALTVTRTFLLAPCPLGDRDGR